jgi:nitrate reductase NapAB chaperone NapD
MPVSGVVVVPAKGKEKDLVEKLDALPGVEVQGVGPNGIAAVLEADSSEELQRLSETIEEWEEVVDFQLAYFNWDDLEEGTT